jgi:hypothetical protein
MYSNNEWDETHFVNGVEVPWRSDFPWIPKSTRSINRERIRDMYEGGNLTPNDIETIIREAMICDYAASFELNPKDHPSFTNEYAGHWLAAKDSLLNDKFESVPKWNRVRRNMHVDYPVTENLKNPEEPKFTAIELLITNKDSKLNPNSPFWFPEDRKKNHIDANSK